MGRDALLDEVVGKPRVMFFLQHVLELLGLAFQVPHRDVVDNEIDAVQDHFGRLDRIGALRHARHDLIDASVQIDGFSCWRKGGRSHDGGKLLLLLLLRLLLLLYLLLVGELSGEGNRGRGEARLERRRALNQRAVVRGGLLLLLLLGYTVLLLLERGEAILEATSTERKPKSAMK